MPLSEDRIDRGRLTELRVQRKDRGGRAEFRQCNIRLVEMPFGLHNQRVRG